MTKTTVTVPANGGPVEAVSTIETVPYWTRSRRKTGKTFVMMQFVIPFFIWVMFSYQPPNQSTVTLLSRY